MDKITGNMKSAVVLLWIVFAIAINHATAERQVLYAADGDVIIIIIIL